MVQSSQRTRAAYEKTIKMDVEPKELAITRIAVGAIDVDGFNLAGYED